MKKKKKTKKNNTLPRNVGFRNVANRRVGEPKISRFSLSRHHFVLSVSLWVSYRGILVVFLKLGTLKCARLEFSGCCVKRVAPKPPGFHTTAQTCTFQGPAFKNTPKFNERTPKRGRKSENCGGRGENKNAKFWEVRRRGAEPVRRRGVQRPVVWRTVVQPQQPQPQQHQHQHRQKWR